jgi:hypothetical protein
MNFIKVYHILAVPHTSIKTLVGQTKLKGLHTGSDESETSD